MNGGNVGTLPAFGLDMVKRHTRPMSLGEWLVREIDPHQAVDHIIKTAPQHAKAKAERVYIENFLRSKKALLMNESDAKSAVEREQYAYSHPEYCDLLEGLKAAVEVEERLKWELVAAQARVEVFRSLEASNRVQDRATR